MEKRVRVYLAPHEYETYLDHCERRTRLGSRIIGESSPRIGKTVELRRNDFFVPDDPNVNIAFVRLRETKDTTEGENALGGKTRISWVPWDLYEEVQQYCEDNGIGGDDKIFDITSKRLGDLIKEAAEATAIATGNEDYRHITSHDFRAFYATNMVRRLGVDIETVMEMGSWGSRKAIEPYLASPLPRDLQNDLARAGVLERDVPVPPQLDEFGEILARLEKIERALDLDRVVDDVRDLTTSEVRALKHHVEEAETKSDQREFEATRSLNEFVNSVTLIGAATVWSGLALDRTVTRITREYNAMNATTAALTPVAGSSAYTIGLLAVILPLMVMSGTIISLDVIAAATGGVLGSTQFEFQGSIEK
ncbi:site-specific integrase [Halosolutus amylolyticus]|uniref:Site-specific integrase n=1 Tax=Halosolutus amylolyticus TaxID=2932267 RepID=A0ABD5PM56_9EURY|nr:site-specific integrase [Halosolutus amylolyticus]